MDRIKSGIHKNKKFCIILTLFLLVFIGCSLVTYKTYVKNYLFNDIIVYKVKTHSDEGIPLENQKFSQEIDNVSTSLTGIGFSLKNIDKDSDNVLNVSIKNQDGSLIQELSVKEKDLNDGFNVVHIDPLNLENQKLIIELSSSGYTNIHVGVTHDAEEDYIKLAKCNVNEVKMNYSLVYGLVNGNCFALKKFYFLIVSLFILLIVLFGILKIFEVQFAKISFVVIFITGIIYSLVLPQFTIPDEWTHYLTAYSQSSVLLHKKAFDEHGNVILYEDGSYYFVRYNIPKLSTYAMEMNELSGHQMVDIKGQRASRAPLSLATFGYIPQTVGVTIGRLLHMNSMQVAFVGRMFALLVYALLISWGISLIPKFAKRIFFAVSMLPMCMQQVCSFNYDSVLLTVSFFLFAYLLYLAYKKDEVNKVDLAIVTICSMTIATIKFIYLPILGIGLLIPAKKFKHKNTKWIYIVLLLVISGLSYGLITKYNQYFWTVHTSVTKPISDAVTFTPSFILRHPIKEIVIFLNTTQQFMAEYIEQMLCSPLGWLDIKMPSVIVAGFSSVLLLSSMSCKDEERSMKWQNRLWLFVLCGLVFGVVLLALQITWTPDYFTFVAGVQGRYFLPVLPLLLVSIFGYLKLNAESKNMDTIMVLSTLCLHIMEVVTILIIVIGR